MLLKFERFDDFVVEGQDMFHPLGKQGENILGVSKARDFEPGILSLSKTYTAFLEK